MPPSSPVHARRRSATRRDELVAAAMRCFARRGVQGTSVDAIVAEAGVAKGTFYLYFPARDDIVTAVAERLVAGIGEAMEAALLDDSRPAPDRIRGIAASMQVVTADSFEAELVREIHRPENAPVHDRLTVPITTRLVPGVRRVIEDGIRDGDFVAQDAGRAAAFVLASYGALEALVLDAGDLAGVTADLDRFVLRGLGHREAREEAPR